MSSLRAASRPPTLPFPHRGEGWLSIPHRFQMPHHPGAQRRLLLRAPFLEAFAGFETEFSVRDQVLQIGRRARPVLDCRQHHVVNRQREVGADLIGVFDRAEHGEAAAERGLDKDKIALL